MPDLVDISQLKIYKVDMSWRGAILVIASNEQEARDMILSVDKNAFINGIPPKSLRTENSLEVQDIIPGVIYQHYGDS